MFQRRQHRAAPPGYAVLPDGNAKGRAVIELFLFVAAVLLAIDQLIIVQPDLYLHTGLSPNQFDARVLLWGCSFSGWLATRWRRWHRSHGGIALLMASLGIAASGVLQFWAMSQDRFATWLAQLPSALAMLTLGACLGTIPRTIHRRYAQVDFARVLLQPFVAASLLALLCVAAVLSNTIGPIRSGLAVAGALAALATLQAAPMGASDSRAFARARLGQHLGQGLLVMYAVAAFLTERFVPLHRVLTSSHPITYFAESDRCTLQVSSGQGAYHVFVDGELRFSTFDERRWAESLVKPALAHVRFPRSAMVLSTGEGLIERELLTDPNIASVTSVVRCPLVPAMARRSGWLRHLTLDAMNSPKVRVVERDPAAYLASTPPETYDVIIVDLPDPSGPRQTKYYSRYFYRLLAARMRSDSILVVQATSARRSPRTYATIGATLQASGLNTRPEVVPLISRGEWSLYLCAKSPIGLPLRPERQANSLAGTTPAQFFHPWPDCLPPDGFVAEPSTLNDAKVLDWFELESEPVADLAGARG